ERRDWVFLFEASGDRDPLLARTQVEVVRGLLAHAEAGDTFTVLAANTKPRLWQKELQPVRTPNVQSALRFLEEAHLIGALDLGAGVRRAMTLLERSANPSLAPRGGATASLGEQRSDVLVKTLPEKIRYIGVGVGKRWDRALMKAAAERTSGYFTQINPD